MFSDSMSTKVMESAGQGCRGRGRLSQLKMLESQYDSKSYLSESTDVHNYAYCDNWCMRLIS